MKRDKLRLILSDKGREYFESGDFDNMAFDYLNRIHHKGNIFEDFLIREEGGILYFQHISPISMRDIEKIERISYIKDIREWFRVRSGWMWQGKIFIVNIGATPLSYEMLKEKISNDALTFDKGNIYLRSPYPPNLSYKIDWENLPKITLNYKADNLKVDEKEIKAKGKDPYDIYQKIAERIKDKIYNDILSVEIEHKISEKCDYATMVALICC